ncbi:TetR/AcrR family transcriptional regulator [Paenibacillus pabuli]|uniref:TetR/AcrR family transcriptional regulator n=1 Tax=Paenibacillus sp. 1781tsa1 TaxID=2953810 RepID=UPI0020555BC3|nr:TetR/AcrR family transcriptional regulator [Paenibacillus pabuli]
MPIQPRERQENERSELREKRRLSIIEAAISIFTQQGFEKATMQEIAKAASLGVATVFRYFPKKEHLIVAAASYIVQSEVIIFEKIVHGEGTCYEKLNEIFDALIFFQQAEHQQNSKLIEAFECYVALSKEPVEHMELYQTEYNKIIGLFTELAALGEQDHSVRAGSNSVNILLTMMNVFGTFSKKMSMLEGIDAFNTRVDPSEQFNLLKSLFLESLKP